MRYEGGCLCGAIRYVAEGKPINERICHCRICQKVLGAAFNARLLFHDTDVQMTGSVARFHSSPALERGFCPVCGTTIFSARKSAGIIGLTVGSLDDPGQFKPDMHFWTSSRQPWLRLNDGLPQYPEGPPG
jgi:hypothetical protein